MWVTSLSPLSAHLRRRSPNSTPPEPSRASNTTKEQLLSTELETTEKMGERNQSGFLILQKEWEKTKEKQK